MKINKNEARKASVLLCATMMMASVAYSYPFNPQPYQVDNQGDIITIQRYGDEHYSFIRTTEGNLIEKDSLGIYRYLNEDGSLSDVKVTQKKVREESEFLENLDRTSVYDAHRKKHPNRHVYPEGEHTRPAWVPVKEISLSAEDGAPAVCKLPKSEHANGTALRFPVIMVAGSGTSNADSLSYWNWFNQEGYNVNGHTGSVRDYFRDNSDGLFAPNFDLYFVTVNNTLSSYSGDNDYTLVVDAISALKNKYSGFDASKYDSDGDGEVDAAVVLYAGTESAANGLGGYQYELTWTKAGRVSAGGNKKFNNYLLIAQMQSNNVILPIATVVHEFSHTMGLRDHYCAYNRDMYEPTYDSNGNVTSYYDFTNQYPGAHAWDVMSVGMYNNGGLTPCGYTAFEKEFMGWISYKTLESSSETTVISPLNTTNLAYKVPVSGDNDEWFVLENRQRTGWDAYLPYHGMLIWHIDYDQEAWDGDQLNDYEEHQRIDVVEAGNIKTVTYYQGFESQYLKDDPYPGSQNVTSFSGFQSWAGTDLGIQLYSITEKDNNIYFTTQSGVSVDTGAEADITGTEGTGGSDVITEEQSFAFTCYLPISTSYETVTIDLSEVADYLGISGQAASLYEEGNAGDLLFYALDADGSLNSTNTANEPGMWYDKEGNVVSYYDDAYVFGELSLASMTLAVGHYPEKVSDGETYTFSQVLVYKGKKAVYTVTVNIGTSSTHLSEAKTGVRMQVEKGMLRILGVCGKINTVRVYDMDGRLYVAETLLDENEEVDLTSYIGRMVVVCVDGKTGKSGMQKMVIK